MGISSKTRKKLWGKSGNRCAICKTELIKPSQANKISIIIGEECHIISKRRRGPRYEERLVNNLDEFENLVLLCRNHHVEIDTNVDGFSKERLRKIKKDHEIWVKASIDNAISPELPKIYELDKINSGKQLVEIINSVHGNIFDYSDLVNDNEINLIGTIFDTLSDYINVFGMGIISKLEEIQIGVEFNQYIKSLKKEGFLIFGATGKIKMSFKDNSSELWDAAIIMIKRNVDNLEKMDKIPVIFDNIRVKL